MISDIKYTWVIGDIHGMRSALNTLYFHIYENYKISKLVFLGDYIDRGSESKGVIDFLLELKESSIFLIGNHEQLLLDIIFEKIDKKTGKKYFYKIGGGKTIDSFGYKSFDKFIINIEKKYIDFLTNLKYSHIEKIPESENQKILFLHAGIIPNINFEEQISIFDYYSYQKFISNNNLAYDETFLWVRKEFFELDSNLWNNNLIIHGHTPVHLLKEWFSKPPHINFKKSINFLKPGFFKYAKFSDNSPFFRLRKKLNTSKVISINLDTGSAYNKKLTALGLNLLNLKNNKIPVKIIQVNIPDNKIQEFSTNISL